MKLTDFVAKFLKEKGIDTVFGVTGGAVVHLFESAHQFGISTVFTHHEQAASFAAGAYSRIKGLGAAFFTTGPGGSNALTGVAAAWVDSVPVIYIGGQVRSQHIKHPSIRQQGAQELDVIALMKPIVKSATLLKHPSMIEQELEHCFTTATQGRPGPVYLEIPLDFQWVNIEKAPTKPYIPRSLSLDTQQASTIRNALANAKRPLFLLGHGIRLAKGEEILDKVLKQTEIPYITSWNGSDLISGEDPLYLGAAGMFGTREANLAIQTCDVLCVIGSHLPIPITTGDIERFASQADIAMINIDPHEIDHQRVPIRYPLVADAALFLSYLSENPISLSIKPWREKCKHLRNRFIKTIDPIQPIDAYKAVLTINQKASENTIFVVDGGGTIVQIAMQTLVIRKGQRLLIDAGLCAMGSGLPHAVGAAFTTKGRPVVCFCGDGSFQFNVHELETIVYHQLPIKLFVFNNGGYLSIRQTQEGFLNGHFLGSSKEGGLSVPNITAVAKSYGLPTRQICETDDLAQTIEEVFKTEGPLVCEIAISPVQTIHPKIGFDQISEGIYQARPIEDMWPFLAREDLAELLRSTDAINFYSM